MGKIQLNISGIDNLMTSQLQLGKGLQPNVEHVSNIFCLCFGGDYLSTLLSAPKLASLLHLDVKAVPLKFSKPGFSNTWTVNLQMFKLGLEKAEEPEIKLQTSAGSLKKQESSRKTSISALLTMPKPSTVWITINCGKFLKRWEYQTTWPASWETYMQFRKQQLQLDMEQ